MFRNRNSAVEYDLKKSWSRIKVDVSGEADK